MKGCKGKSQESYIYPPTDVEWHGERVIVDTCPVNLVQPDTMDLFSRWALCDGKLTFSEQDNLPAPYLEAFELISTYKTAATAQKVKHGR